MLKRIFPESQSQTASDSSGQKDSDFKSVEDQLKELDEHISQQLAQKPFAKNPDSIKPGSSTELKADKETNEFIQLADFISQERNKKSLGEEPFQAGKVVQLQKYKSAKTKEFEAQVRQKGLQINKAA